MSHLEYDRSDLYPIGTHDQNGIYMQNGSYVYNKNVDCRPTLGASES